MYFDYVPHTVCRSMWRLRHAALHCPNNSLGAEAQGADGAVEAPALQRTRIDFS